MEKELKPLHKISTRITVGDRGLDAGGIRNLAEKNPSHFLAICQEMADEGEISWERVPNLGKLFHSLDAVDVVAQEPRCGEERTITASAFPVLCGALTVAGFNKAYAQQPTISQELVTEVNDNKRFSEYISLQSIDIDVDGVREGQDFPLIGAGEETFSIHHKRGGRRFQITSEAIEENDVSNIVRLVNALARLASNHIERQSLRRICDIDGSGSSPAEPYALHWNKTGTALYQTSNSTLTQLPSDGNRYENNALVDTTDLDNARGRLAGMKDNNGERIYIPMSECTLLVPDALMATASKLVNSELEPGIANEMNNWGPAAKTGWRPRLLSSPMLDDLSATTWYLGWFDQQFTRKWKLQLEYATQSGNTPDFVRSRLAFEARIAWDVEVGATDYVYVIQNLSGTTPP